MPRYTATVSMTLKIVTEIGIRAKDEATATDRVQAMIEEARFGTLEWQVVGARIRHLEWDEEEVNVAIDGIGED